MITSITRAGWAAALVVSGTLLLASCGSTSTGTAATASGSASATPTPSPTAGAVAPVVLAQSVGTMGTILVAASNSHTVYTFDSDSPGVSTCNGGCATIWPPLTVPMGTTPTGGP